MTVIKRLFIKHLIPGLMTNVFFIYCSLALSSLHAENKGVSSPISIGNRRELFVDNWIIEDLQNAQRRLHHPVAREIAIVHDQPWEGNVCYYHTVFRDDDLYRMYYRGAHSGSRTSHPKSIDHEVVCYAESHDGIHWEKPSLGLHLFQGSRQNNIVWTGLGTHNFVPFKDSNPNCNPQFPYKAVGATHEGLYIFQSADGIHWSLIKEHPVITEGRFDSQNLAFYDVFRGRYVAFQRGFKNGVRTVMTATSADFLDWSDPEFIHFNDSRNEHLYTNQTIPYYRAPHILLSFPKRFIPERNPTLHRHKGVSDIVFMSSRDGKTFDRWGEAFLRPGLQKERWVNRNNFVAWGIPETESEQSGTSKEMSFYSMEGYYTGDDSRMRRYTLRPDGFVSVTAPLSGGTLTTKPLTFSVPNPNHPRTINDQRPFPIQVERDSPIHGDASLYFIRPAYLTFEETSNLGSQVTLAVTVRDVPPGVRRLFSTYDGGTTVPNELFFDINSGGVIGNNGLFSVRFNYNGVQVGASYERIGNWSSEVDSNAVHHVAATWNDGRITLYFDGQQVAKGGVDGSGDLHFRTGNLRFGEDYPPTSVENEPFLGVADDLLVLRQALSEKQIAEIAQSAMSADAISLSHGGIHLSMETFGFPLADHLADDGHQKTSSAGISRPGEVELLVNFSTSASGSIRCEILDQDGAPVPGFSLTDCDTLYGDSLERAMSWQGNRELKPLAGQVIRLRFELQDADLFSLRFSR